MEKLTIKEFNELWETKKNNIEELVEFLSKRLEAVVMDNGNSYSIQNKEDLVAVFEAELYHDLTGREQ